LRVWQGCADEAGVDALNTTLETVIFAATMNFGQSWKTVLIQFASASHHHQRPQRLTGA
jgi:hypothetical protein